MEVVLTPAARETFRAIVLFIRVKWGEKSAERFKSETLKTLHIISTQPYMFKASAINNSVRQGFISKQTSVIYEVEVKRIVVLYFWDNRQNPIWTDNG